MKTLMAWIGNTDIKAAQSGIKGDSGSKGREEIGPIARAMQEESYDHICLLDNYSRSEGKFPSGKEVKIFQEWLAERFGKYCKKIEYRSVELKGGPTNYREIYNAAKTILEEKKKIKNFKPTFHLSPGTSAMALVWMLLAPEYGAKLIESSKEAGVRPVELPFSINAYYLTNEEIARMADAKARYGAFARIIHGSKIMDDVIRHAKNMAARDITVLIEGESGTGKELFARAIHDASMRKNKNFVSINCGAIPSELLEAELFGNTPGAFTGALKRDGAFRSANGGTLFLDEIGELPLSAQVKLLRVLQERKVKPVGSDKEESIDVRIIAATNRNLMKEVGEKRFRADLLYRIAVGIVKIPPLREREEDIKLLIEHFLKEARKKMHIGADKNFSDSAIKLMLEHSWPGNVRELESTVNRAVLWNDTADRRDDPREDRGEIDESDVRNSFLSSYPETFETPEPAVNQSTNHDQPAANMENQLPPGFSLNEALANLEIDCLKRAWEQSGNNKTEAANLLGLNTYQTFDNKMKKHGLY